MFSRDTDQYDKKSDARSSRRKRRVVGSGTSPAGALEEGELLALVPHLRAMAWFLTTKRDRADILVRDAIIRGGKGAHRSRASTSLKIGMLSNLRNLHYEEMRKNRVQIPVLNDPLIYQPSILPTEAASLEFGDFRRAFWQLPDDRREVLILVGSGLLNSEAAQVCGCTTRTIRSRALRARRELLQILEDALLAHRRRDALVD